MAARATGLALLGVLAAGNAAQADQAESFIARAEAGLRDARAAPDAAARQHRCAALVATLFDPAALAESTAGATWQSLSAADRAALTAAVQRRLGQECPALLARPDTGAATILRRRETPSGLRVTTQLPAADGAGAVLTWTLASDAGGGWRARDLVADGRGVAAALRSEFEAALAVRDGDVARAIADLGGGGRR
jgi:ABC-type transporter MlaC component